ncbi:S-adenosylmethionine:tRNA ribosyltransferase-isomerase [Amycolatopsis acidiphila]|uniref:S-adenosylmethionine:tRNA ribosyltransferase-isomerase n=1 Tax=Amycolatopsis acidiphila TaxID=715473 RepID=A0A558A589_9PSEU|nr:S-adenosylmethionine:tRNA ribosyltransferase-isomerase [Amycolatopsis acidiphila]TVT19434.1 S-adenosylmethionine:tRNA ribosyltransferase-isomerase [Amycolatopsis acidiphila]UIJ56756.1 S-adenosylmethionine:tRNA ribosyltransferase-isomerase [Amycolatopsis acidiphila]GHG55314.1 queuosine biosynthesis protein [Amycolatopsis acidiphila]
MTIPFTLPPDSEAGRPPERRGLRRDGVRLLVARPGGIEHRRFRDVAELLEPGDLVVVNTSATLPAALDAVRDNGSPAPVHVSTPLDDGDWVVEVRRTDASGPDLSLRAGERLGLPGGVTLTLVGPYLSARLWRASVSPKVSAQHYLPEHGRPIGYGYLTGRFPLRDYQTVYATEPGSAEMASAGRPFTEPLLVRLMARGVIVAPVLLHAGVSSPELHEPPNAERFAVPAATARLVDVVRAAGQRVVAVGTTVVRALESAAGPDGAMHAASGWTELVLGPDRPARVVGGLVTGLHVPEASHLLLLEAVAGRRLVEAAYAAAVERRYLWHEFGDSTLFLP